MLRFIKTINSFIIGYTFKRAEDIVDLELRLFLDDGISHSSLLVSITISSIFIIFLLLRLVNANSHSSTSTTNVQGSTHLFWSSSSSHSSAHLARPAHFSFSSSLSKTSLSMERLPLPFQNFAMWTQLSFYATFFFEGWNIFLRHRTLLSEDGMFSLEI
jgi:hypothetical protein